MTRLWVLTFFGKPRWAEGTHPHESPWTMTVPLMVLAVFSLMFGWFNTPARLAFDHFLAPSFAFITHPEAPSLQSLFILGTLAFVVAIGGIVWSWSRYHREELPVEEGGFWTDGLNAFYVDDLYGRVFVAPGKRVSEWFADTVDPKIIDGAATGIAHGVESFGDELKVAQSGRVRGYAAGIAIGGILLIIGFLLLGGGI
jgi:NADH-quinone oxidoreductase subunit L